jgi:cytochrome c oxidase subunit 3
MPASALDAATVVEVEPRVPGGGGPGNEGPDGGDGGGGGDHDDHGSPSLLRLGVLLIIASVGALFITLALVFWFRAQSAFLWQSVETPRALWMSTAVLALSSLTLELSRKSLADKHWFAYRRRLLLTIYLGLAFIACQCAALVELMRQGMFLRGNPHASMFYVFTAAHGVHLVFGVIALNVLLFRRDRNGPRHRTHSEAVAIYWHFMGVIWAGLFALLLNWS